MKYTLWLTILLAAGCARMEVTDEMEARGCRVTCALCLDADIVCADKLDTKGQRREEDIGEPALIINQRKELMDQMKTR